MLQGESWHHSSPRWPQPWPTEYSHNRQNRPLRQAGQRWQCTGSGTAGAPLAETLEGIGHTLFGALLVFGHLDLATVTAEHPLEELKPHERGRQRRQNPPPAPGGHRIHLEAVGRYAAERALSRVGARKISTRECPVLFEAPLAAGLLGHFVQAVSGGTLYRKNTFLAGSLGQPVFAGHVEITENPFIPGGRGSAPFDGEGVRVTPRQVVQAGRVAGYFLGSYSARKLGMKTTGNAGGSHNLRLYSRQTSAQDDLPAMLQKLGTGLFVTELMGSGVNYVTGDYSRGASGYWVENGQIAYPVQEVTIAGNLREMFLNLQAIGADAYTYGAKTSGSVLIARMKVAGS